MSPRKPSTAKDVVALAKETGVKMVDWKFCDLPGQWQHFSIPVGELEEDQFTDGLGFDGSSIRGFQKIHESDMLLMPDPTTAIVDPACRIPTLSVICNIANPKDKSPYTRDPRYVAQKAEAYLTKSGVATTSYWGPEAEFFVFNSVRFDQTSHSGFYEIDSDEGIWNSGAAGKNLGYRPRTKEGYFPVPPTDKLQDLRSEMVLKMIESGLNVEVHHHEVGTAGQAEIDLRFDTMTTMGDAMLLFKYIIKNVAYQNGYTATFMPKPLFGDNGSGMHVHQSLWKDKTNLFWDPKGYAGLSDTARHYIGGLLAHAPALLALCAPTTNSYRRLVPGYEAPVNLMYSQANRSAAVRIPVYSQSPKAKRIEFRCPDPSANPYLCFAALLMAGLDGIEKKTEPPTPIDKDLYELEPEEAAHIKSTPGSLLEVLTALENDHEFLLRGDVFTQDLIETWIEYKREREAQQVALRPHPHEFHLYYDV
ncbi:MAG: type I glutamate--ammonia ligase [Chloroflexota bacterium]|nr:MAG: type I glutamate--ammonia ligase [Chloroflexota bacterium]